MRCACVFAGCISCGAETPLLSSIVGDIFGMCVPYTIFAKIDPKDTVGKLNKSKLSGNVNVIHHMRTITKYIWGLPKCGILANLAISSHFLASFSNNEHFF